MPSAATIPKLEPAPAADLAALRPAWEELARRSGNLFATPDWLDLWWRHFGRGEPTVWTVDEGEDTVAVLPLYRNDGTLRFMGHGAGDELGPIAAADRLAAAAAGLGTLLTSGELEWERFLADDVPEGVQWTELTGAAVVRRTPSPVLGLSGLTFDRYLATRTASLRRRARAWARLMTGGEAVVRTTGDPERLDGDLDTLFRLHRARWGKDADPAFAERGERFHREVAAAALRRGWLRLRVLELEGRAAAALLSFRFGGDEWFYQGGRDPAFDRLAPGLGLHLHAIREAIADGLRAYRLLRGGEDYKRRLADRDRGVVTLRLDRR